MEACGLREWTIAAGTVDARLAPRRRPDPAGGLTRAP